MLHASVEFSVKDFAEWANIDLPQKYLQMDPSIFVQTNIFSNYSSLFDQYIAHIEEKEEEQRSKEEEQRSKEQLHDFSYLNTKVPIEEKYTWDKESQKLINYAKTAGIKDQILNLLNTVFGGSWDNVTKAIEEYKQEKQGFKTAGIFDKAKTWLMITLIAAMLGTTAQNVMAGPLDWLTKAKSQTESVDKKPEWVNKTFYFNEDKTIAYGVGSASYIDDAYRLRSIADNKARGELARGLNSKTLTLSIPIDHWQDPNTGEFFSLVESPVKENTKQTKHVDLSSEFSKIKNKIEQNKDRLVDLEMYDRSNTNLEKIIKLNKDGKDQTKILEFLKKLNDIIDSSIQ